MKLIMILILSVLTLHAWSQDVALDVINETVNKKAAKEYITFLASDEMRGRGTGTPEIDQAAEYLANQFEVAGIKPIDRARGYFQPVEMVRHAAPSIINFTVEDETFNYIDDMLMLKGSNLLSEGDIVYVGYGNESDFSDVNVKGKIVVALTGTSEQTTGKTHTSDDLLGKQLRVKQRGALALIEIMTFEDVDWSILSSYLIDRSTEVTLDDEREYVPHFWMKESESKAIEQLMKEGHASGSLTIEIPEPYLFSDNNIIGMVEGTDPKLKDEYVVLSAHYDHIGVFKTESEDSIHNGARDNAIGTAAILLAGRALAKNPPKRSVIIMALCAEEVDLLGSQWYVEHPMVPLNQTVYDLNCDGAGYNDKRLITLIDLKRTTADEIFKKAGKQFGLKLKGDPAPSEDLYESSDNYNFALQGIPSVNIAPGVKKFNKELMKYYHEPSDEVSSLDFDYLEKFLRAYAYSAYLIANADQIPTWKPGDEFEDIGKKLYNLK